MCQAKQHLHSIRNIRWFQLFAGLRSFCPFVHAGKRLKPNSRSPIIKNGW